MRTADRGDDDTRRHGPRLRRPHVRHGASLRRGRAEAGDRRSSGASDRAGDGAAASTPSRRASSADGTTIAFVASPSELGYNQIGVMGADGSDPHFISTPNVVVGATVAISPDASKVAFEGLTTGRADIYVVGVDGTGAATADHRSGDRPVPAMVARRDGRSSTTTPARTRTARIPSSRRRRRSSLFPSAAARPRGSRTTAGPTPRPRIPRTGRRSWISPPRTSR